MYNPKEITEIVKGAFHNLQDYLNSGILYAEFTIYDLPAKMKGRLVIATIRLNREDTMKDVFDYRILVIGSINNSYKIKTIASIPGIPGNCLPDEEEFEYLYEEILKDESPQDHNRIVSTLENITPDKIFWDFIGKSNAFTGDVIVRPGVQVLYDKKLKILLEDGNTAEHDITFDFLYQSLRSVVEEIDSLIHGHPSMSTQLGMVVIPQGDDIPTINYRIKVHDSEVGEILFSYWIEISTEDSHIQVKGNRDYYYHDRDIDDYSKADPFSPTIFNLKNFTGKDVVKDFFQKMVAHEDNKMLKLSRN